MRSMVILVVLAAFGLLVIVHELGHFAVARLSRMRVERFSVGFGPVLLRSQRGETEWAVSAVPFGGYVKIAGMGAGEEIDPADAGAYANQPAWRRFLVILAGPGMNYLFAVVLAAASTSIRLRKPCASKGRRNWPCKLSFDRHLLSRRCGGAVGPRRRRVDRGRLTR